MKSDAMRNLHAELRAVESGQHAMWSRDRRCIEVLSETEDGVRRHVTATATSVEIMFRCDCPAGLRQFGMGVAGCRHSALLARRLEREGLAHFTGARWVVTEKALDLASPRCHCGARAVTPSATECVEHTDPFAGLPRG